MAKKNADRSRAERAAEAVREQERAEQRRRLMVVGAVVAVVVIVIGGGFFLQSQRDTTGEATSSTSSTGGDGTPEGVDGFAVPVGQEDAPTTITLYEDFLCPICGQLEAAVGDDLDQAVADGRVRLEYRPVSFLDRASDNEYSSRAANAAIAVLDVAGPEAYQAFHKIAFANQPEEGGPGPEDDELIDWAVQAGADEAAVTPLIEDKAFGQWIVNATDQMSKDGVNGTPSAAIDGELVDGFPLEAIQQALGS